MNEELKGPETGPRIENPETDEVLDTPKTPENRPTDEYAQAAFTSVDTLAVDTSDTLRTTEQETLSRASKESELSSDEVSEVKATEGIDGKFSSISERITSAAKTAKEKILSILPGRKEQATESAVSKSEQPNATKPETKENRERKEAAMEKASEKRAGLLRKTLGKFATFAKEHNLSDKVDLIPLVGNVSMLAKGVIGRDYLTGEKLSRKERLVYATVGGLGVAADFVPVAGEVDEGLKDAVILGKEGAAAAGIVGKTTGYVEKLGSRLGSAEGAKSKKAGRVFSTIGSFMRRNPEVVKKVEGRVATLAEEQLKKHPRRQAREHLDQEKRAA